jgi:molybdenum cofactor cytidylyltransferase
MSSVLVHPEGGARGLPPAARFVVLLNQADDVDRLAAGRQAAIEAVCLGARRVVIASAREPQPVRAVAVSPQSGSHTQRPHVAATRVSAVVLAAGQALRMGQPKLKLPLGGKGLLCRVVETALAAPVDEVVVVLGAHAVEMAEELPPDRRLRAVYNPRYVAGQSTSLIVGLGALSPAAQAAAFLLGDQPLVSPDVLSSLIDVHVRTHSQIVQPLYWDGPGHPVLFARALFPELLEASGDRGGREVLTRHRAEIATVRVEHLAPADVDTVADYERLACLFSGR